MALSRHTSGLQPQVGIFFKKLLLFTPTALVEQRTQPRSQIVLSLAWRAVARVGAVTAAL